MLERALPELAGAVRRRRADPTVLDPGQVLRFSLVEEIRETVRTDPAAALAQHRLEHPEWLLLAALILDTAGEDAEPVAVARRLVQRLDLGAAAEQEIALLVGDSGLLRAAAGRVDGMSEESVLQLAVHLEPAERTRALYILSLALSELDPVERARLDELVDLVLDRARATRADGPRGAQPGGATAGRRDAARERRRAGARADPARAPRVPHLAGTGRRRASGEDDRAGPGAAVRRGCS